MVKEVLKYWPYLVGCLIVIAIIVSVILLVPSSEEVKVEEEDVEVPEVVEEVVEEEEEEVEEEGTTTGGGTTVGTSGGTAGGGTTSGSGGSDDEDETIIVTACEDSSFPLIESITNEGTVEFCYLEEDYTLEVSWGEGQVRITSTLTAEEEIEPMDYEFGEDDDGLLMHGRVNLYDVDEDGVEDLYMKPLYADQDTGDITFDLVNLDILIDIEGIENCLQEEDEDGDWLFGCEEAECNMVYGFYGPERGDPLSFCTYGRELLCEDNFDNDGNGEVDELDMGCIGLSCSAGGYWTWSYLYGEDQSSPPARIGCCEEDQCINIAGECINYDTYYDTASGEGYYICGDRNYWDRCGPPNTDNVNKEQGEASDGERYLCAKDMESNFYWLFRIVP